MDLAYILTSILALITASVTAIGIAKPTLLHTVTKKKVHRKHLASAGIAATIGLTGVTGFVYPDTIQQAHLDSGHTVRSTASSVQSTEPKSAPPEVIVEKKEIHESQPIAYQQEQKNDNTVPAGQTLLAQVGKNGERIITYEATYTDGKETARTYKSEYVNTQPVNEIVLVGTYIPPAQSNSSSSAITQPPSNAQQSVRKGALCKDGTRSSATSNGACSHHGGVLRWLLGN